MSDLNHSKHSWSEIASYCSSLWYQIKSELSKSLRLGKKMIHAGKTSVELKDTLSELGLKIYQNIKANHIKSENLEIQNLVGKVDYLEQVMNGHEGDIRRMKAK